MTLRATPRGAVLALFALAWSGPPAAAGCKVAIDAGHSRADSGAETASGKTEYSYNRRLTEELVALSREKSGLSLFIVNPGGETLKLSERPRRAAAKGADVFVSIHHDSVNDKYLMSKIVDGKKRNYTTAFRGYSLFVSRQNRRFEESRKIAEAIGGALNKAGLTPSLHHAEPIPGEGRELLDRERGVYNAPFSVLRTASMPAVLVEAGVVTNPAEEALLDMRDYRGRIETALLDALETYCGR